MSEAAKFKGIVERMAAGLWAMDGGGRTTYVNPWLAHWLGCEPEAMAGREVEAFLFEEDAESCAERCARMGRGTGEAWEQRFRAASGGELWGWVSAVPGVGGGLLMTMQDLGGRKPAEAQLRNSESWFRTIAETAADAEGWFDPQFRLLWVNGSIERITGYTAAECLAMPSFPCPLISVPDWASLRSEMERTETNDGGNEHRFRFLRRDGESRWGSATWRFVRDEQRRPLGWRVNVRDVTAQVRAEEDLDQYRLVISATRDGVALLDSDYRYRIVNDTYEEVAGLPKERLLGHSVGEYLGAEVFSRVLKPMLDRCLRGEVVKFEDWFSYPSGLRRRMAVTYFPYRDREGRVKGVVANSRDTTDQWEAEKALRESEQFRQVVFDSVASHLAVLDPKGVIVAVNQAWRRFAEQNAETKACEAHHAWVGSNYLAACRGCEGSDANSAGDAYDGILGVLEGRRQSFSLDYPCHSPTERRWFSMIATALGGNQGGAVVAHSNVTRLELAREALKLSEVRWRSYLANAPVGVIVADAEGRHLEANTWAEQMFGYGPGEMRGTRIDDLPDEEYSERCRALFMDLQEKGRIEGEVRLRRRDGSRLWASVRGCRLPGAQFLALFQDITLRKRAEDELRSSREQLRALASALSRTEHRERRRIALLLHDEVIQRMAIAQIQLGQLRANLGDECPQDALIEGIRGHIERAIAITRTMTFQLSPPILHELGLAPALAWLVERFSEEHSLRCECTLDDTGISLDEETRNLLFAAARELLMNVVKHARASQVWIGTSVKDGVVEVQVADNGAGFDDATSLHSPGRHGGFGLFSIRERLGFLGGGCRIESTPGQGTRARIWAPVSPAGVG